MSIIKEQKLNWIETEKTETVKENIERLSEGEYNAYLHLLSVEQEEYLNKVINLYNTNPSCELHNVINLLEQIEKEFKKLKS